MSRFGEYNWSLSPQESYDRIKDTEKCYEDYRSLKEERKYRKRYKYSRTYYDDEDAFYYDDLYGGFY